MRRRTFDRILSAVGFLMTVVLVAAGSLLMWGYSFANSNVHDQLSQQQIYFPPLGSKALASPKIGPYLNQYAGQEVLTGPQAEAYANHFIAVHLSEMQYNGVYSTISAQAMKDPTNAQLKALEQTSFQGTTLRGLLLEAYAFWQIGQIALYASIAAFVGAGLMLILSILGEFHLRRVSEKAEI